MQCDVKDELPSSSLSETKDNTASTSLPKTKDDTSVSVTKSDAEVCGVSHTGEHENDKEKHVEDQDDTSCLEIQNIKFIDSSESDLTVCGKKTEKSENQIKDSYVIPEEESEKQHTGEECQKLDYESNGKEKIKIEQETVHKEQTENVSEISDSLNSDQTKETWTKNMENKVLEQSNIDKVKEREITQNMEPKERETIQNMEPRETTQSRESKERGVSPDIQIQDSEQVPNVSDKPKINTEEDQNEDLSDSAVIKIEGVEVKETDVDDLEGVGKGENTEGSETPDKEDEKEYEIPSIEAFLPFTNYVNLKKLNINKFAAFVDNTDRENVLMHYLKHKDLKKLKSLLRHSPWSVNHPIRDSLWSHVCRYLHKAEGNVYEEFEKDLFANSKYFMLP